MFIAAVLLFSSGLLNTKPSPVFAEVFIGTNGPYRFLVDTGSQTSLIDPKLAERLDLKPEFRVQVVTQNTTRLLPGLKTDALRIGEKQLGATEVIFHDLTEARRFDNSVQGVLGMNALSEFPFALFPRSGILDAGAKRPAGETVPLYRVEDRIAVKAQMGSESLTLILDSGATHMVLFRTPEAMARTPTVPTTFGTLEGARAVVPTCWTANMAISRSLTFGTLPAAIVTRTGTSVDGLIPASLFKAIYVDQSRGEVTLLR